MPLAPIGPGAEPFGPVPPVMFEQTLPPIAFEQTLAPVAVPTPVELAAVPTLIPLSEARVAGGQPPAEAAVRWRVRAATVDNLLVYGLYLLLCWVLHWRPLTVGHVLVLLTLGVVYHFVLESMGGQTIGKRRYGIQVVSVDGGRATPKGIALRSILRFIDALPFGYLSGLISMVRTGPERRQRIGDVAGETKVIAVSGRAATRGTPGWLLPAATIFALAYSCLGIYGIAEAGHQPLSGAQEAEFISGCQNSATGQLLDCQCLLTRLEADGYNTPASLQTLVQDAQAERLYGQSGTARTELTTVAFACHR